MKPKPPTHLSEASRKLWVSIYENYDIDEAAEMVLTAVLEALDRRTEAREAIATSGAVLCDRFGCPKPSPWCAIERDSALAMYRGWRLLGFDQTPRSDGRKS